MKNRIILENQRIHAVYDTSLGGFVSLTSPLDQHKADFLLTPEEFPEYDVDVCEWLGNVDGVLLRDGVRIPFYTGGSRKHAETSVSEDCIRVAWPVRDERGDLLGLTVSCCYRLTDDGLRWDVTLKNQTAADMTFVNLNLPLLMNQYFRNDDDFKYDRVVMRHTCITGHSSYMYWEKSSGNGPVLLLAPLGDAGFDNRLVEKRHPVFGTQYRLGCYEGLIRACVVSEEPEILVGQPGSLTLAAAGEKTLSFALVMLPDEAQINDALHALSLTTLKAVPGMVGPLDEDFFVMTRPVEAKVILCEPEDTLLDTEVKNGWRVSRLRFGGYGRRWVQVDNGGNVASYCFFATEPVAAMIQQHAAFIARNHLETDPEDPCYHGLLIWDMVNKRRINSSFNPYMEPWWSGGSDDPGLVSGLFLSEKNVYQPVEEEIQVLHAYVEDFILLRLTEQPGWRVHRMVPWYTMFEPWAGRGADDVWRAFNYVHVINTLWNMYRIQKQVKHPLLREANEYLKMAYEYTKPMFNYWMFPHGVGASEFGNMGEMTLPLYLSQDLMKEGFVQEATELAAIFDKKSHFFNSKAFPFGSEMPYDSTAFEAVYGYGKRIGSDHIMRSAARASYSNRGKQPVWYLYSTDLRASSDSCWNTSYMTQLGAYPIMDYTLNEGHINEDWIMAYYGAYLSGWLIYNSGGYWDADEANRGATGWITVSEKINRTDRPMRKDGKLLMPLNKGLVVLSGEAGLGFFGALRTACSIVMDHSVLGRIGLGCEIKAEDGREVIIPRDGLAVRFYHVPQCWRVEVEGGSIECIETNGRVVSIRASAVSRDKLHIRICTIPGENEPARTILDRCVCASEAPLTFAAEL